MNIEGFIKYCDINSIGKNDPLEKKEHATLCRRILNEPLMVGIRKVSKKWLVVQFVGEDYSEISRPDVIFLDGYNDVHIVECKATNLPGRGSPEQLRASFQYAHEKFGIEPRLVYVRKPDFRKIQVHVVQPNIEDLFPLAAQNNL